MRPSIIRTAVKVPLPTRGALAGGSHRRLLIPRGTRSSSSKPEGFDNPDSFEFFGLSTFSNIPYANSLSAQSNAEYDIAILGAPFDAGVTGRPGARFGPRGIRAGSSRIYPEAAWSAYTGRNPFKSGAKVVDCGDVPLTWSGDAAALAQLEAAHKIVASRPTASATQGSIPRIIALGGDHTTTLPALRAAFQKWGAMSVIHFDAHLDTWDPEVLGSESQINHGTFLHIAYEEGLIANNNIHAGIRGPVIRPSEDWENDRRCGFSTVTARDLDTMGPQGVIKAIRRRVEHSKVYISVDIDVLDPAYAPATGTPEVGGWTTRELLTILDGLVGLKVVGADVVEVAPVYDNAGETTVLAASEIVVSLLDIMIHTPVE